MELYLVALLLPEEVSQQVWALKQEVHQLTDSRNAIRLPPHITLIPPLRQPPEFAGQATRLLASFAAAHHACRVQLHDFRWFQQRTLYVAVTEAAELHELHSALYQLCGRQLLPVPQSTRPFVPHVTLATRDLPPAQVPALRAVFEERRLHAPAVLQQLVLFRHDGQVWQREAEFHLQPVVA
ncbi:2'-5' RNA ligase family protein [Hymenobacter endophyticus]|uniref:2'-5' RNA ligase family protein n=1 Tax=Hymenobacter endophyticus TaxID=3076335 RepID=A0ABU3TFY0_9BACT|nr:2'-5' RNA ligase family protein [Hymenobacter endophyticus]MDU0370250.1 2'-5' RNA ligase family protein [Hymenobacter endophyticus]